MPRFIMLPLGLVAGCVGAKAPPSPPSEPPYPPAGDRFHVDVEVFGDGIAGPNGASDFVTLEVSFADASVVPVVAPIPVTAFGVSLSTPTASCLQPGRELVFQFAQLGSFELLDDSSVRGHVGFACSYDDGSSFSVEDQEMAYTSP